MGVGVTVPLTAVIDSVPEYALPELKLLFTSKTTYSPAAGAVQLTEPDMLVCESSATGPMPQYQVC